MKHFKCVDQCLHTEGMSVRWWIANARLCCVVRAPTLGWVAIGFNRTSELRGTNLVMGCVRHGHVIIEERYIVQPGTHRAKQALGAHDRMHDHLGIEEPCATTIQFSLPCYANDPFSYDFVAGDSYCMLLAYSLETDFDHHSLVRTTHQIVL